MEHGDLRPVSVLLVDDHKTMLWGLERLVGGERTGMKVVATASSREQAIAATCTWSPDVILLDIDLNGECSIDFLPALLVNGVSRALIFSGTRDESLLDRAVLAGARGVLRKDAPAEVLLRAIDKVHQGELWLDHEMMARIFGAFTKPRAAPKLDPEAAKLASLTSRERKIVDAIIDGNGMSNKALAQSLFISEHTLRNYLVSIYKKLEVNNRLELYVYAVTHRTAAKAG